MMILIILNYLVFLECMKETVRIREIQKVQEAANRFHSMVWGLTIMMILFLSIYTSSLKENGMKENIGLVKGAKYRMGTGNMESGNLANFTKGKESFIFRHQNLFRAVCRMSLPIATIMAVLDRLILKILDFFSKEHMMLIIKTKVLFQVHISTLNKLF